MGSRSFIFDVGNILLHWSPEEILRSALPAGAERAHFMRGIFAHPRWIDLDRGRVDQNQAAEEFAASVGCETHEILRILRVGQESLVPLAAGVSLLNELHEKGRDLICLTNMSRETFEHVRPKFPFWNVFRGIVVSGQVMMAKPEPAIFRYTLERYGLEAASTVFVDDHPANVDAARSLGIVAIQYDGSESCLNEIRGLAGLP